MKIAFIVSCLEPGQDGVGDYTRRLAAECIRQGHPSIIVSLNDSKVSGHLFTEQTVEGTSVSVLRLPSVLSWNDRVTTARKWLGEFNPNWISLQFVAFGFHPKGLPFGLGKHLTTLNSKASWHIMFHELWLGLGENSSIKHRLWGWLQRGIVRDLIRCLQPKITHTQTEPYREVLGWEGIKSSILPLFGNIPLAVRNGWDGLLESLTTKALGQRKDREQLYLAGIFGRVHPEWDAELAVNTLLPLVQYFQKRLVLVFFGKSNLSPESFGQLKIRLQNHAEVVIAGERSADEISSLLQSLDLGLATTPRQIIKKSGSVAAMLEYGLPVLIIRDDWHLRGVKFLTEETCGRLFSPQQFATLQTLPIRVVQPSEDSQIRKVASQMLEAMKS